MLRETNALRRCNDVKQDEILHFERWSRVDLQKFIWVAQCLQQLQTRLWVQSASKHDRIQKDTLLYSIFILLLLNLFRMFQINQPMLASRRQSFQWNWSKTCWLVLWRLSLSTRLLVIVSTFPQGPSEGRPKYGSKSTNNPQMVPRRSSQLCPREWQVQQNRVELFTLCYCLCELAPSWAIPAGPGFCRGPLGRSPAPAVGLASSARQKRSDSTLYSVPKMETWTRRVKRLMRNTTK